MHVRQCDGRSSREARGAPNMMLPAPTKTTLKSSPLLPPVATTLRKGVSFRPMYARGATSEAHPTRRAMCKKRQA